MSVHGRYVVKRPTGVGLLSRGRDYSVKDLGGSLAGYTDLLRKELGVSLNAEAPQTRWTQLHELAHVQWSLYSPERIRAKMRTRLGRMLPVDAILAAEDARINEKVTRAIPDAHEGFEVADVDKLRKDITGYAASHASPPALADAIRPACDMSDVARVDAERRRIAALPDDELTIMRATIPLACILADIMKGRSEKPTEGEKTKAEKGDTEGDEGGSEKDGEDDGKGVKADADEKDGSGEDAETFGEPDAHAHASKHSCGSPVPPSEHGGTDEVHSVIPTVVEPELNVPIRAGNFTTQSSETGTQVRWTHLHRIQTDGVMFRRPRRRPGAMQRGTVLIDASASMRFTTEDLDRLLDMLPYATVAIYSGTGGKSAWVVVVARNGRRVKSVDDVPRSGGNTCDGPALLWLSRMPAPRLWVCDGYVTGSGDSGATIISEECAAIMESGQIVQLSGGWERSATPGAPVVHVVNITRKLIVGRPPKVDASLADALRRVERGQY